MAFDLIGFIQGVTSGSVFGEYTVAVLVFILSWVILKIFQEVILHHIRKMAEQTETKLDDAAVVFLESLGWPLYITVSLYLSLHFVVLPPLAEKIFTYLTYLVVIYYSARGVNKALDFSFEEYIKEAKVRDKGFDDSVAEVILKVSKAVLWLIAFLLFLQNLGYQVTALIAGLGIGGIAVAFALQSILGDIFAYFSISFDKPFKVGDNIKVVDDIGEVKKIGLKSTRIKTLQGEELIVSNKDLTSNSIRNYKNMDSRRVAFEIGIETKTPAAKLRKIPAIIESVMKPMKLVRFEKAYLKSFSDFSIIFEIIYHIKSPKYTDYMNVHHEVNLGIKSRFEKARINIAVKKG